MSGVEGKLFQHNDNIRNGGKFMQKKNAAIALSLLNAKMDNNTWHD
jgi:hypothetical protein